MEVKETAWQVALEMSLLSADSQPRTHGILGVQNGGEDRGKQQVTCL